jgi:hypothetical protein
VAEIILNKTCVIATIGEIVAGGMAQHVGMDRKAELGALPTLVMYQFS